mmetsp:Transcript_18871/g.33525  ORF Transcript_18871/g.33525 Transcript_18871/m.33525 type:complete len:227 (-) Transcript_18871:324-1004(-)
MLLTTTTPTMTTTTTTITTATAAHTATRACLLDRASNSKSTSRMASPSVSSAQVCAFHSHMKQRCWTGIVVVVVVAVVVVEAIVVVDGSWKKPPLEPPLEATPSTWALAWPGSPPGPCCWYFPAKTWALCSVITTSSLSSKISSKLGNQSSREAQPSRRLMPQIATSSSYRTARTLLLTHVSGTRKLKTGSHLLPMHRSRSSVFRKPQKRLRPCSCGTSSAKPKSS